MTRAGFYIELRLALFDKHVALGFRPLHWRLYFSSGLRSGSGAFGPITYGWNFP